MARYARLRARDSDRVDACAMLDAAQQDGQLPAAEHTRRTTAAMAASTFGDLDPLLADLQIPEHLENTPVLDPRHRPRSRRWLVAAFAVVLTGCLGGIVGAIGGTARDATSSARTESSPSMTTGRGMAYFIDRYRMRFGNANVDQVVLFPDYAVIARPVDGSPHQVARYHYSGNSGSFDDRGVTPRAGTAATPDLAAIDLTALAAVIAGAPTTLRVPDGRVQHLIIENQAGSAAPIPVVEIFAHDNAGRSGHLTISFAGEPISVFPAAG